MSNKEDLIRAIGAEIKMRKSELPKLHLETIYFGGGTPSLLSDKEIGFLFETISEHFDIRNDAEITLEANPDDLTVAKIKQLKNSPINRLSIGIQSFRDQDLKTMNRAHNADEAERSVKVSQDIGITNITADLIYGLPEQSLNDWRSNLHKLIALDVPHLSSYCLTVEPKTALTQLVKTGQIVPATEQISSDHFHALVEETAKVGFEHYEISNFAKEGFIAVHNSSYWKGEPYLGVGPSAHSFAGHTRKWNVANNTSYMKSIFANEAAYKQETLSISEQYNERVMLGLRAKWGVDHARISNDFGANYATHFEREIQPWIKSGDAITSNRITTLTQQGRLLADRIASSAFFVNDPK